jgi:predicted nucleotidyltransferase
MEKQILKLLEESGPMTGAEVWEHMGGNGLLLWRACRLSNAVIMGTVGTRYLRLDRRVPGFGRLSPSIFREFLTYRVLGCNGQEHAVRQKCCAVESHIEEVTRTKLDLAYRTMVSLASHLATEIPVEANSCFIIAGDIVYAMAHDVPRPERSTGKLVNGSDLDIVVIVPDDFPEPILKRLDDAIYREKYRLLITPHIREEIDYVLKRTGKVRDQLKFDTFRHKLACKIMREGTFLCGSEDLFHEIKMLLRESGVAEKLDSMERKARIFRKKAEHYLLHEDPKKILEKNLSLFYPADESEEFE